MNAVLTIPTMREYKLMYKFGAWITAEKVCAESDKEAIFDTRERADEIKTRGFEVALFDGNRKVNF